VKAHMGHLLRCRLLWGCRCFGDVGKASDGDNGEQQGDRFGTANSEGMIRFASANAAVRNTTDKKSTVAGII